MLHILSIGVSKSYKSSAGGRDEHSSASSYGSPVMRSGSRFRGSSPNITEDLLKDLLSAALNAAGFSERQRWELSEATDHARHHFRISPLSQWWPFEVLGRRSHMDEDVVEASIPYMASGYVANRNRSNSSTRTSWRIIQLLGLTWDPLAGSHTSRRTLTLRPIPWTQSETWSGSFCMRLSRGGSRASWGMNCRTSWEDGCDVVIDREQCWASEDTALALFSNKTIMFAPKPKVSRDSTGIERRRNHARGGRQVDEKDERWTG